MIESRPVSNVPGTPGQAAQQALRRLVALPHATYQELLTVPARYALDQLAADSASLSRWERDRAVITTLVNEGDLAPHETRLPTDEVHELAAVAAVSTVLRGEPAWISRDGPLDAVQRATLDRVGRGSALSLPVVVDGRLWGELWVTRHDASYGPDDVGRGVEVADEVASMVVVAERLHRMAELALQDPLTRLANRRVLDDVLAERLAEDGPGATVVMCDLDELKTINDELGHAAGDRAIVATADALAAAAGEVSGGLAVRYGGDEFVVVLPGAQRTAAILVVEAAARVLRALPEPVRISAGVVEISAGAEPGAAVDAADRAQYAAKTRGALFVVATASAGAADELPDPAVLPMRRASDTRRMRARSALAVRNVMSVLADRAPHAPPLGRIRLRWLAEMCLTPFDLEHWTLSSVDLAGDRRLRVNSMGLRFADDPAGVPLKLSSVYALDDFPLSRRAVHDEGWFVVRADDPAADPSERDVLRYLQVGYVVALGCRDGDQGWLLELYGRPRSVDPEDVAHVVAIGCGLLLGRPFARVTDAGD